MSYFQEVQNHRWRRQSEHLSCRVQESHFWTWSRYGQGCGTDMFWVIWQRRIWINWLRWILTATQGEYLGWYWLMLKDFATKAWKGNFYCISSVIIVDVIWPAMTIFIMFKFCPNLHKKLHGMLLAYFVVCFPFCTHCQ